MRDGVFKHTSRVELYINRGEAAANKKILDELESHKGEIEATFGEPLLWQRLDAKKACRISYEMSTGGIRDDESTWRDIQVQMIDAMVRFEKAFMPFIQGLDAKS